MVPRVLTLVMCFVLQAVARPHATQTPFRTTGEEDGCPTGIHIVGVRGFFDGRDFGNLEHLVNKLLADIPGSDSIPIDYPANGVSIKDGRAFYQLKQYASSTQIGYIQLTRELIDFKKKCPDTSVVLLGYSQGAHVSGDVLCGSDILGFPPRAALRDEYKENIKAIITLGDPRNNRSTPVHGGTSRNDGRFIRRSFKKCGANTVSSWKTYCDATDNICDVGGSIEAHLHYVGDYFYDIIGFIKGKLAE